MKYIITKEDIIKGKHALKNEIIIEPNYDTIFQSILYTILSQREQYKVQVNFYHKLQDENLITPHEILSRPVDLWNIVKGMSLNNSKFTRIMLAADSYKKSNIHNKLIYSKNKTRKEQIKIRNEFVKKIFGINNKSASMIMMKCGCSKIAILDIWVLRFLEYDRPVFSSLQYIKLENELIKQSKKFNISLILYSVSIWAKLSSYKPSIIIERKYTQNNMDDFG